LHQCLEAEKAILPTDGGPTDQGRLVQRSTDNPCFQGTRAQRLSIFKAGSPELDGNRGGAMMLSSIPWMAVGEIKGLKNVNGLLFADQ
jgi:hypothetical protein